MSRLNEAERAVYEWQLSIPGFGEDAQEKLRACTALISRCGGLGGEPWLITLLAPDSAV